MARRFSRVAFAMEGVVQIGVGLWLLRTRYQSTANFEHQENAITWPNLLNWFGGSFLIGVILAMGMGLCVEVLTKRSPSRWGWGRLSISIDALSILLLIVIQLFDGFDPNSNPLQSAYSGLVAFEPWLYLGPTSAAIGLTWWMSRQPTEPDADLREMTGRVVAITMFATSLLYKVSEGREFWGTR